MEFILDIAEFLLQAIILLGVFLIAFAGVMALSQRKAWCGGRRALWRRDHSMSVFEMHAGSESAQSTEDPAGK